MEHPIENTQKEVSTFEEYLSAFLPNILENQVNTNITPEETGIRMAQETLTQIQNLLLDNNKKA